MSPSHESRSSGIADEMNKHTPGPWRVAEGRDGCMTTVADMTERFGAPGRIAEALLESDARLIAVAPELLDIAKRYAGECAECGGGAEIIRNDHFGDPEWDRAEPCPACADIRAVIDRAEGRS